MTGDPRKDVDAAWIEHNVSQLRYFQSLSLRAKLEAVQGMADVLRHFRQMRTDGRFSSAAEVRGSSEAI